MQMDEKYDDLTALFETQDEGLKNEVFVKNVMQPIRRRNRWRAPILFGAGGVGFGTALSQIGGVWSYLKAQTPTRFETDFSASLNNLPTADFTLETASVWMIAAVFMIMMCAVLVMTERA